MDPRFPRIGTMKLEDTFTPRRHNDIPIPKVTTLPVVLSFSFPGTLACTDMTR